MAVRQTARFGWVRDLPDPRDHLYSAPSTILAALPPSVDLSPRCPVVYDQGPIGSCTANAIAGAIEFDRLQAQQTPAFTPSRLFIYYNERAIEGSIPYDAGAQIRDGIKTVAQQGACPEADWPYRPTPALYDGGPFPAGSAPATRPTAACYAEATGHRAIRYQRVAQVLNQLKGCLAAGFPFVFGFTVFTSLYDAAGNPKSQVPLPSGLDEPIGGHAVMAVGYDDAHQQFKVRNSWGDQVQDHGYFFLPYAYLADAHLAADFWTIRALAA